MMIHCSSWINQNNWDLPFQEKFIFQIILIRRILSLYFKEIRDEILEPRTTTSVGITHVRQNYI